MSGATAGGACTVVTCDPGREFAFAVAGPDATTVNTWRYRLARGTPWNGRGRSPGCHRAPGAGLGDGQSAHAELRTLAGLHSYSLARMKTGLSSARIGQVREWPMIVASFRDC